MTKIDRRLAIGAAALALVLSAHDATAGAADRAEPKLISLFGLGGEPTSGQAAKNPHSVDCPRLMVDGGAAELRSPAGADAASVRYQISLVEVARECVVQGDRLAIILGVAGAAALGPLGQPGAYFGALRVGVRNMKSDEIIASKTYRVGATIPPGAARAEFKLNTDVFFVPYENAGSAGNFEIIVGFAPGGGETADKPKKQRQRRRR